MKLAKLIESRWGGLAAKAALSALVLYISLRSVDFDLVRVKLRSIEPWALILGLTACFAQNCLVAVRWRGLVSFLGNELSFWRMLWIVEISSFFSQALPATVGIDGVRIFHLWRRGVAIERAVHSVLLDRLVGVAGLLLAGILGIIFATNLDDRVVGLMVLSGVLSVMIAASVIYFRRLWLALLPRRVADILGRFASAGVELVGHPLVLLWALLPSIGVQLLSVLLIYIALHQLNVPIPFMACVLLVTPVMLLITLPISIAGWGVREGALVLALGLTSVPAQEAVVASLLAGLAQLVVALPGGILLLAYRRNAVQTTE